MSLAQHVTQSQGFDYDKASTDGQPSRYEDEEATSPSPPVQSGKPPKWRRMNFAPIRTTTKEPRAAAAYNVSVTRRIVQVATGVVACWFSAGIVFGFAALKPVLIARGVYSDLCDDKASVVPCDEQDLRLNLFFVVASVTANVTSLLAGSALDKYGRRACWVFASMSLLLGCLLMGASFAIPSLDGYLVANVLLSLGGTFIFVPSFQLANALPKYSGTIVALITGAFDASAAVFLFYRLIYEATDGWLSLEKFFFGYTLVPVLFIIAEFAYMPPRSYHTLSQLEQKIDKVMDEGRDAPESDQDIHDAGEVVRVQSSRAERRAAKLDRIENIAGDTEHRDERRKMEEDRQAASGVWGVMHGVSARKQMLSSWFMLILSLTTLQMLRMNYFIATIRAQYRFMLGSEDSAAKINHFFDVALPVGGVITIPFISILLNNFSVTTTFGSLTILIIIIGILNCLPHLWAGYATVIAFVMFRPFYYSAISDYATKVFGYSTFGRIYGTLICVSGVVSLAQSGLDSLTHEALHGDPTPINIAFAISGACVGVALTIYVRVKSSLPASRERRTQDVSEERRPLLSGNPNGHGTLG